MTVAAIAARRSLVLGWSMASLCLIRPSGSATAGRQSVCAVASADREREADAGVALPVLDGALLEVCGDALQIGGRHIPGDHRVRTAAADQMRST